MEQRGKGEAAKIPEKSHFHGKAEVDKATGKSWIEAPKDHKKENDTCFLPKVRHSAKCVAFPILYLVPKKDIAA